ncbi:hypothetical protein DL93DRAFT_2228320, partial [Clavulina sp. PMI_390]
MTTTENDKSLSLPTGHAMLSVQNVLFRIPKAILANHAETFAIMFESSKGSEDDPVCLDDPIEAFRDFVDILL